MGLKIAVIVLLFNAFFKLKKLMNINLVGYIMFFATLAIMLVDTIFNLHIPSLSLIIIALGLLVGVIYEAITKTIKKEGEKWSSLNFFAPSF